MKKATQSSTGWDRLAWALDEMFRIPGTRVRFGLDALIGLVPGAGEWMTSVLQALLVMDIVARRDIPVAVALRMVLNVAIDGALGAIPFVGDLFDAFFKANTRNVRLMREVAAERAATGKISGLRHTLFVIAVGAALLTILALAGTAAFLIARALFQWLGGVAQ